MSSRVSRLSMSRKSDHFRFFSPAAGKAWSRCSSEAWGWSDSWSAHYSQSPIGVCQRELGSEHQINQTTCYHKCFHEVYYWLSGRGHLVTSLVFRSLLLPKLFVPEFLLTLPNSIRICCEMIWNGCPIECSLLSTWPVCHAMDRYVEKSLRWHTNQSACGNRREQPKFGGSRENSILRWKM